MILKALLFPFRAVYLILRTIFFPWFLRWFFYLPWFLLIALAGVVGFFGYQEYENYLFEGADAQYRLENGTPPLTKLSQWNLSTDTDEYGELNVAGLFFSQLSGGTFTVDDTVYSFVPLADDQGREVKAALVVPFADVTDLLSHLRSQGSGDRVPVIINGEYNYSRDIEQRVRFQLQNAGIPGASNLAIIDPYMGDRAGAIFDRVEDAWNIMLGMGVFGGLLVVLGLGKLGNDLSQKPAQPKPAPAPAPAPATQQTARAGKRTISPSSGNKVAPNAPTDGSPWGSFQPQPRTPAAPAGKVAPQKNAKTKPSKTSKDDVELIGDPEFKSVFPGGGSSFRFKTADEIIRETFGTLSVLTRKIDPPK